MNEQNAVTEFDKGNQLLQEGELEDAIAAYCRAIELNPANSWFHQQLGEALAKLGRWEEAVTAFRCAIELKPDFSWSYHHLGDSLAQQQKWEESAVAFRKAIELNPAHFGTFVGLGNTLAKLGQFDEAIAAYRRASELNPDADWIHHALANALEERTQLDLAEALASYRHMIELNPDNVEGYHHLLQIQPDNLGAWLQLAQAFVRQEQMEEAIAAYRRALELNPKSFLLHQQLGKVLANQGDVAEAIVSYRHMIELNPDNVEGYHNLLQIQPDNLEAWLQLAQAFVRQEQIEEAIAAYRCAVDRNPSSGKVYHQLGSLLAREEKWEEAIVVYQQAVEFSQDLPQTYYLLGESQAKLGDREEASRCYRRTAELLEGEGKIDEAIAAYQQVVLQQPSVADYLNLGMLLCQKYRLEESLKCYQKALDIQPEERDSCFNLAKLLIQEGFLNEVMACYHQVSNSDSSHAGVYHQLSINLAKQGLINEALVCFQQTPQRHPSAGEVCEYIWKGLNQLGPLDETSVYCQTEIQLATAETHFRETSQCTVFAIDFLADSAKIFLEKSGFSISNLELMSRDDINLEEIYINNFHQNQRGHLARKVEKKLWEGLGHPDVTQGLDFQQSMVETGYIYSICPISGRIVRSNQSFNFGDTNIVYRFIGVNVFYLIVGGWGGSKRSIYFPHLEIILIRGKDWWALQTSQNTINTLKSCVASYWVLFKSYINSQQKKETVALSGFIANIGHFFWNDMSGLQNLYENGILEKIDKFSVGLYEYFSIANIFPEIPLEKFIHPAKTGIDIFKTIMSNNYFCIRPTDLVVTEKLANRLIQASLKRCSSAFLQELERVRQHFPIIWVGCRYRSRIWVSQVEGTANLIKSLYSEFPNLAVVFGGWSPKESEEATPEEISHLKAPIKTFVEEVLDILPTYIQTYNAFGRPNYENILLCNAIDLYIATLGSETCYLSMISNKPGIIHANTGFPGYVVEPLYVEARENCIPPVVIDSKYIVDQDKSNHMTRNYDCDWQVIYNEAIKIIYNSIISQAEGHRR
ncbi:tetratricopeptide repeat protein [Microcoleus sp. Z1_A1]|uniref:tetratricopeptide repeat protein n=1 Tax=unclassified Microcoleus TaxID=2642155 RepID=UPI002FD73F38